MVGLRQFLAGHWTSREVELAERLSSVEAKVNLLITLNVGVLTLVVAKVVGL